MIMICAVGMMLSAISVVKHSGSGESAIPAEKSMRILIGFSQLRKNITHKILIHRQIIAAKIAKADAL